MKSKFLVYKPILFYFKSNHPCLIISEEGILYNSFLGNLGIISWLEIEKIDFIQFAPKSIHIKLNNFDSIKCRLSLFKQKVSELYFKQKGAQIIIFQQQINIPLEELYSEMMKYQNQFGSYIKKGF